MTDDIKQTEPSEVLSPEGEKNKEFPFTFLEYLDSDRGHEIAKTVLGLWKELQQATLGYYDADRPWRSRDNHGGHSRVAFQNGRHDCGIP
jgi:hypothetical protein